MFLEFKRAAHYVLNLVLPPKCLKCSGLVTDAHNICPDCWKDIHFISSPMCECCGYPFGPELGGGLSSIDDTLCGACQKGGQSFDKVISAIRYDDDSRNMVIGFKHQDRTEYTGYFTKLIKRAGKSLFKDTDILIPVPLHKKRLLSRRYNQSALLSGQLSAELDIEHQPLALQRIKDTPPQQGNMNKRSKNVRGAFKVCKYADVNNKVILLIDDVYTTGATAENCAKALKKAGAKRVYVLTVFRVIMPQTLK
ncbi:MAG: ComF family protein [Emcibacteraceae bacterium]|nr:ComF family protein [Emcibacteraceae bacterium]